MDAVSLSKVDAEASVRGHQVVYSVTTSLIVTVAIETRAGDVVIVEEPWSSVVAKVTLVVISNRVETGVDAGGPVVVASCLEGMAVLVS